MDALDCRVGRLEPCVRGLGTRVRGLDPLSRLGGRVPARLDLLVGRLAPRADALETVVDGLEAYVRRLEIFVTARERTSTRLGLSKREIEDGCESKVEWVLRRTLVAGRGSCRRWSGEPQSCARP